MGCQVGRGRVSLDNDITSSACLDVLTDNPSPSHSHSQSNSPAFLHSFPGQAREGQVAWNYFPSHCEEVAGAGGTVVTRSLAVGAAVYDGAGCCF